jgi:type I restriction enzyme M protein
VTVEQPLRLRLDLTRERRKSFRSQCSEAGEEPLADVIDRIALEIGPGPHQDFNAFLETLSGTATRYGLKMNAKREKLIKAALTERDETAPPVVKKIHKKGTEPDPLRGLFDTTINGKPAVVEYEPDSDLRDTEQIPLLEEGGIETFIKREVLPYTPDAWYVADSVKTGYEISFTRYFYKPQQLRTLEEIRADILTLEKETEGLLDEIIGNRETEG